MLGSLESGGLVANISGTQRKSVALDEAHEMFINRETKACLTRITPTLYPSWLDTYPTEVAYLLT